MKDVTVDCLVESWTGANITLSSGFDCCKLALLERKDGKCLPFEEEEQIVLALGEAECISEENPGNRHL